MRLAAESYRECRRITSSSGSNFSRAFTLLPTAQREAMEAVYAFARIADDQSDAPKEVSGHWCANDWREWIDGIYSQADRHILPATSISPTTSTSVSSSHDSLAIASLEPIRLALQDSVHQFQIPKEAFNLLIDGIDFDQSESGVIQNWNQLRLYCEQVAGSMGLACLAIWSSPRQDDMPSGDSCVFPSALRTLAIDCGIAFQLTNILRDLVEDAARGRCYLPMDDLKRCGLEPNQWFDGMAQVSTGNTLTREFEHKVERLLQVYFEKGMGYYLSGIRLKSMLPNSGQRMFSLMFATYRSLLQKMQKEPLISLRKRVRLSKFEKLRLGICHVLTPLYQSDATPHSASSITEVLTSVHTNSSQSKNRRERGMKVGVVGGGLAGIQASLDLARHGVEVTLFEAKSKLGGRAGSYWDSTAQGYVDYCQHVGMKCCTALQRWILLTEQEGQWRECSELHFVSKKAKRVSIKAWPLPPPFHLGSIIAKWPDLRLLDRLAIGRGMLQMVLWKPLATEEPIDALTWLRRAGQTQQSIEHFWNVILVSALGELPQNASARAMRKVLIDGFARARDASHLLVPSRSLQQLVGENSARSLASLGVKIRMSEPVRQVVHNRESDHVSLVLKDGAVEKFNAVIVCSTWRQAASLLNLNPEDKAFAESIGSSPITGIHTWWDKSWLDTPHAIFIDSICQWAFTGPRGTETEGVEEGNVYYQIVVSASRDLQALSQQEIADRIAAEVRDRFVAARSAKLLRYRIVTDPNAVFSCSPSVDVKRWEATHLRDQRVYLAGDWTNSGWPATMEGALRSGTSAAESLLSDLFHPVQITCVREPRHI